MLADTERLAARLHESGPGARVQIASRRARRSRSRGELMEESAELARRLGLALHTHLAETVEEEAYCRELYGCRPVEYLERLGWLAEDVWCAHCVHLSTEDVASFASAGVGVAHCPTVEPAARRGCRAGPRAGRRTACASASASTARPRTSAATSLRGEAGAARRARPRRAGGDDRARGAAPRHARRRAVLGRDDIGSLEPGKCADFAVWRTDGLELGGADDPVAGLVLLRAPPRRPARRRRRGGRSRRAGS